MISRKAVLLTSAALVLAISIAAFAVPTSRKADGQRTQKGQMCADIDLTDAQKAKIKQIKDSYQPQFEALHGNTSLTSEQKKSELQALRTKVRAEISQVLTPEQRQKCEQMKSKSGYGKQDGRRAPGMLLEKLELTDDQKAKVKSIRESYKPKLDALRADTGLSQDQKQSRAQELRAAMRAEIDQVLTPEQRQKLGQMKRKAGSEAKTQQK